jgi:hypothetical protein
LWINIGDKWASGGNGGGAADKNVAAHAYEHPNWRKPPPDYKDKDLVGIPFMLAFALRADGWWWRQCNIWAKPNGMPESTTDRSSIAHEYVLMFSRSPTYHYDGDAVRLPMAPSSVGRLQRAMDANMGAGGFVISGGYYAPPGQGAHTGPERAARLEGAPHGRHALGEALPEAERRDKSGAPRGASLRSGIRSLRLDDGR